jgi:hypothetical protein
MTEPLLTRRLFLGRAATVSGVLAFGAFAAPADPASGTLVVYVLDPDAGRGGGCCQACTACRGHAANSYFATAADADLHRAHPYCQCAVIEGPALPYNTWIALFGPPAAIARPRVDKRTPWVADTLAAAATPPAPSPTPEPSEPLPDPPAAATVTATTPEAQTQTPPSSTAAPLAVAGVAPRASAPLIITIGLRCIRAGTAKRVIALKLNLRRPANVHTRILQNSGQVVASHHFQAPTGNSLQRLSIPNGLPPGTYTASLVLQTAAERLELKRPLTIN